MAIVVYLFECPIRTGALLQSVLDGPSFAETQAVTIVDLYPRVGDLQMAFMKQRQLFTNASLFYVGVCEDQTEQDWITEHILESLVEAYVDGTATLPVKAEKDVNEDLLEPIPQLPKMNLLVVGGPEKNRLQCPISLVKEWQFHPTFGKEFVAWLEGFLADYKLVEEEEAEGSPNPKRTNEDVSLPQPSPKLKKQKQLQVDQLELNQITDPLVHEVKAGKDGVVVQLRGLNKVYILNKSQQEAHFSSESYLLGFGKGSFKLIKEKDESASASMAEFALKSSEDFVVFNGNVMTVGAVLADLRKKKPETQVCYHKIIPNESSPKLFELSQTHRVGFLTKDGPGSEGEPEAQSHHGNFATKGSLSAWNSTILMVVWNVRASAKGLMPVKPAVHLRGGLAVGAGRAVKCSDD